MAIRKLRQLGKGKLTEPTITGELPRILSANMLCEDFGPFFGASAASQIPMLVADLIDDELIVVFVNDSFLKLTKRPRQFILDCPLENVLAQSFGPASLQSILLALAAGQAGAWILECRPLGGETFLATAFAGSVRSRNNTLSHNFISIVRQEEPADQLRTEREQNNAMYDNAPGFIAITDSPEHRFTYANASFKGFVNCPDLVGRTVAEALPEITEQGFVELLDEVFTTGVPYHGRDVEIFVPKGENVALEKRYCNFVYQPIYASDGSVSGLFCEGYDVTERHKSREKLAVLNTQVIQLSRMNAMGTMAATLAHELNQPIAAIANYAAAGKLHLGTSSESDRQSAMDAVLAIAEIAERTGDMVRNLRKLTQTGEVQKAVFDLTSAISECIQLVIAGAEPGVEIVDRTENPVMVTANRIQIQQVIINLLKNAEESASSPDRQKVEICAKHREGFITICVKDCGTGVADAAKNTLFALNETTKEDGMGIGLSISRSIVESHGGRIWLERTGPDGSEFCFTLPTLSDDS